MKQALISLLVVAGLFTSLNAQAQKARAGAVKAPAKANATQTGPKIGTLKPADFGKFKDSAKGKVLVLNFWATWCGPCVAEFPELVSLDAKYRDKGVKFIGITADDAEDVRPKVIPFIKKHQVKFDIVQQDLEDAEEVMNQITKDWNGVIPVTVVYDKQGNLAYSRFGIIDRDLLVAEIEKALK
ncbi:MAG TPA: TlpA disulfide reductase family protein [Blastocatellia bacterium]|nr:TlpA disulfide reductase family protein [Blastocatellia bacterium]